MSSSTLTLYKGFYAGGQPSVTDPQPFDVAQDLSTGNLWQYTGSNWLAPGWTTVLGITLGAGTSVCSRIASTDTVVPSSVTLYAGDNELVPASLALTAADLCIWHDVGNFNIDVAVYRTDYTADVKVGVAFPAGSMISTPDGTWTVLKNFNTVVGVDLCSIDLTFKPSGGQTGPQQAYQLPAATYTSLGGIIADPATLDITSGGVLSVRSDVYVLPPATYSSLGGVIPDSATLQVTSGGVLSVNPVTATYTSLGVVIPDSGTIKITSSGVITAVGVTEAETVLNETDTDAYIPELQAGKRYIFTLPLESLTISTDESGNRGATVAFQANSTTEPPINLPLDTGKIDGVTDCLTDEYRLLSFKSGLAVGVTGNSRIIAYDPFDIHVDGAEVFGAVQSLENHSVSINRGDLVTYWTENTTAPSATFYWVGSVPTSGDVWLSVRNMTFTTILYGLAAGATRSGVFHMSISDTTLGNAGLAGTSGSTVGGIDCTLTNVSCTGSVYLSQGSVTDFIRMSANNFNLSAASQWDGILYRASNQGNAVQTVGDCYVELTDFAAPMTWGFCGRVLTNAAATGSVSDFGNFTGVLNSGEMPDDGVSTTNAALLAGYLKGQSNLVGRTYKNLSWYIRGGTWTNKEYIRNGVGVFCGPLVAGGTATAENIYMEATGGTMASLRGTGYCQNAGKFQVTGGVELVLDGADCLLLTGMSTGADTGGTNEIMGDVLITLKSGSVSMVIPGAVHNNQGGVYDILHGTDTVRITGKQDWTVNLVGYTYLRGTVDYTHRGYVEFVDYIGTVTASDYDEAYGSGAVRGFQEVRIQKGTSVTFGSTISDSENDKWVLDMSERPLNMSAVLPVIGHSPLAPDVILNNGHTHIPATGWALYASETLPGPVSVYEWTSEDTKTLLCTLDALDTVVDGFKLQIVSGVLYLIPSA